MMNKKPINCDVYPTADLGYDTDTHRYFANVYIVFGKKEYMACVGCDDFDPKTLEATNMTIEFMNNENANNIHIPYNEQLFQEIQVVTAELFLELKQEEKDAVGV